MSLRATILSEVEGNLVVWATKQEITPTGLLRRCIPRNDSDSQRIYRGGDPTIDAGISLGRTTL
jgi:hypothetical protein